MKKEEIAENFSQNEDEEDSTYEYVSKKLKFSKMRIWQIEKRTLKKLKKILSKF